MGYKFYNPNPDDKFVGDCVIRAVSKITRQSWEETYLGVSMLGLVMHDMPSSDNVWGEYLYRRGYRKHVITSVQNLIAANSLYRTLYWSSSSAIALYATNAYGAYQTPTSPSLSGSTLTIKTPVLGVRGSTTYFTSTYMNALTDIRYQYVIDVYRAPLDNLNIDGWGQEQMLQHLADCINSANHTLT